MNLLQELAAIHGLENIEIQLEQTPLEFAFGLFAFTSSDRKRKLVWFKLSEERYKLEDGYKITLDSITVDGQVYAPGHFYQSDLCAMIRQGYAKIRISNIEQLEVTA